MNEAYVSNSKFQNNEECALALFMHLKKVGQIKGTEYDRETILHDINNLRGHEWLECLERNLTTKPFFDYLPRADWFEDQFAYGRAVEPNIFLKVVLDKDFPKNISFDELRDILDNSGLDHLWDYCVEDLDEAIDNLSDDMYLLGVSFYTKDGYFARIFEIDQDAVERLDNMLVVTELGDYVLPCDVRPNDTIIGPYSSNKGSNIGSEKKSPSLDAQIQNATSRIKETGVKPKDNVIDR